MKIIQIAEPLQAGVGQHVVDLALGLVSRGHDVHVLYSPIRVDDVLERQLIDDGRVTLRRLEMRRAPNPRDLTAIARTLAYLYENGPFDVVHAHSSKAGLVGRIAAMASASAVVYTPHAFATMALDEFTARRRGLYGLVERILAAASDTLICGSQKEFEHARDVIGVPGRRIRVIPNGLNPAGFRRDADLHAELGLTPDARLIGAVARRLDRQKGVDLAVRAMRVLHQTLPPGGPDIRLVVLGDGPSKVSLRSLAVDCGVEGAVFWLGWRTAREYFHCFRLLFAPSRYEGSPYTPMEALFSGVPVVGTRCGVGDAVKDGFNGFVVPPEDPEALAMAAMRILTEPGLHDRLSSAARRTAVSFSPETMVRAIEDVYLARRPTDVASAARRHGRSEEGVAGRKFWPRA